MGVSFGDFWSQNDGPDHVLIQNLPTWDLVDGGHSLAISVRISATFSDVKTNAGDVLVQKRNIFPTQRRNLSI